MNMAELKVHRGDDHYITLIMPSATTMEYAAMRFAEVFGLDLEGYDYFLVFNGHEVDPKSVAAGFEVFVLYLGVRPRVWEM